MTRRRILLTLLLLVGGGGVAVAQAAADPAAYLRAIYRSYEQDRAAPWYSLNYTPRLRALIQADRKKAKGEVGAFDFNPIINGQDYQLSNIRIQLDSQQGDATVVNVVFHNFGSDQHMRFNLARIGGKWAIDEIAALDKPRWTMSKVLQGAPDAFPDK